MNSYFCVMPFYGLNLNYSQKTVSCCLMEPEHDLASVRSEMLSGQRPGACKRCWDIEDAGKTSDRQLKNASFDYYKDRDIRLIEQDCQDGQYSTQIVQIATSNLCNAQCTVCSPQFSTAWATLRQVETKLYKLPDSEIDNLDLQNIKMLSFVGGEPLYDKRNLAILKKMLSLGNRDCFITVVTNGSIIPTTEYIDTLKQFTNLNFCLSIDGTNKTFEYIRYPTKWPQLLKNIEQYRSIGINLSVSFTVSILNILEYHNIVQWFKDNGLNYNHNMVLYPECFNINTLPNEVKQELPDLASFFRPHTDRDDTNFQKFCAEIRRQDAMKGTDISAYIPKVAELIKRYGK